MVSLFPHPASFRFRLTTDTLAFGYLLPATGRIRGFHPLEMCAAGRTQKTDCFRCGKQSVFICRYSAGLASSGVAGMGVKLGSGVGCGACVCSGVGSGVSSGIGVSRGSTVSTDDVISGRGVITVS